jgi:HK97 family phage major capsid protein
MKSKLFFPVLAMFAALLAIGAQALGVFDVQAWIGLHPDLAAGLSMLAVVGRIEDEGSIQAALNRISEELKTPIAEIKARLLETEQKLNRRGSGDASGSNGGDVGGVKYLKTKDGNEVPLLAKGQKFGDLYDTDDGEGFNLGDFARNVIVGSRKAASGAALVPTYQGSRIIDAVRARTVLVEAGAGTIVIDGPTNLARLTSGPTVYQHTEAANDIEESEIVAVPVTLNPKLLAVLIPLTVELVQDSPNLDAILNAALSAAFAAKLDALAIATLLADPAIAKSAAAQDPALWIKVLEAVGAALALNQALPTAHISAPADFIARASQMSSTAGNWLGAPPALATMRELQTSGLTAGTSLFGNFSEAFAFALRSDLRVEVVRHAKPNSGSHLLIAHMRADGVVLQPGHLFKQLKTIV